MTDGICGREADTERIRKYAESGIVGNQAFLGVKGVGKTTLFQSYFSKEKRAQIAREYKNIFVFSGLDERKQGTDLYRYLLDQVKIGILRGIPDKDVVHSIKTEMDEIDEIFETPESRLTQYLNVIKDEGYQFILIMDQFHCMARDTEIGKEQYDVLRSYNEQKLITYWIITDTDLMETCASKQYIASFFAQKFTSKMTIRPMDRENCSGALAYFESEKKTGLSDREREIVTDVSGGVPELMSILLDLLHMAKNEEKQIDREMLSELAMADAACMSLFDGWTSGLSDPQKQILLEVARAEDGLDQNRISTTESKMAELADDVGRGLLHVRKETEGKTWRINIPLFQKYILHKGDSFLYGEELPVTETEKEQTETHITNIYHISGNLIQSQTNNVLNIENAVTGLEDLQRLISGNPALLDGGQVLGKLDYLPFRQEAWTEMDEEEQEEELEKYADGVFSSDLFANGVLTQEQMDRFCLTEALLDQLSSGCRTQIMCGIQVYDLIQLCVERFGLSMAESESPRGILFARAFERHLKDFAAPAYCRIPEMAQRQVFPSTKAFKDYPLGKTTIGTYSSMLRDGYRIFAQISGQLLNRSELDEKWWKMLSNRLIEIGDLRNDCCHSGMEFDNRKLNDLTGKIFKQHTLSDVLIFGEIPVINTRFSSGKKSAASPAGTQPSKKSKGGSLSYKNPDISLLGRKVEFEVQSKTDRGNWKGTVNGIYEGSLPKAMVAKLDFGTLQHQTIEAIADKIQDGKYVLKLK